MGDNVTFKILRSHLVEGNLKPGEKNLLRIDQALMQDATGTMALMQYETLGLKEIAIPFAIVYVDHNMLQLDHCNPDDHLFLQTFTSRHGIHFSKPGNGICHQVNVERFAAPGLTLIGSDSHTPTSGALGCLAIGAGGLDVGVVLGGHPFGLTTPIVVRVLLKGKLSPWVASKDIILEMLRRLSVRGGVGKIYEFTGKGVKTLSVTQRATISNMITELGATSAVFPSDERTLEFLRLQKREGCFKPLEADPDAKYDEEMVIDLKKVVPLIACPSSPDNVLPVGDIAGKKVAQVCVGSSVNSWYEDLAIPALILKGNKLPSHLTMTVSPGSRQILDTIVHTGIYEHYLLAGARILEPACGPCVGMGQAPPSGEPSVRTFNRNFPGRSGTINDQVYLSSPATAGATALRGVITDPRTLGKPPRISQPRHYVIDDSMLIPPLPRDEREKVEVRRGPNIKPPPINVPLSDDVNGEILIKLGDNISTGAMAPDGAIVMAYRSNVPKIAEFTFRKEDPDFVRRAKEKKGGFILAGENYGQGSSREHAALAPLYLGVRAVLAMSFARIHRLNLVHQGLIPLIISRETYNDLKQGDSILFSGIRQEIEKGSKELTLKAGSKEYKARLEIDEEERRSILAGGLLNYLKGKK